MMMTKKVKFAHLNQYFSTNTSTKFQDLFHFSIARSYQSGKYFRFYRIKNFLFPQTDLTLTCTVRLDSNLGQSNFMTVVGKKKCRNPGVPALCSWLAQPPRWDPQSGFHKWPHILLHTRLVWMNFSFQKLVMCEIVIQS